MHISLDSALGRQRRLNQIGETITSIATPAAAYSLRSLTGGDPLAVRVRRSSGGTDPEKDFTVSQINSGALLDHVGSGNDGHVSIWYDQIGSNNLVNTDTAQQPKIIKSGSFIVSSTGNIGIGLLRSASEGLGQLDFTSSLNVANSFILQVVEFQRNFSFTLIQNTGGGNARIGFQSSSTLTVRNGTTKNFSAGFNIADVPILYTTFIAPDSGTSKFHINGVEKLSEVLSDTTAPTFNNLGRGDNDNNDPIVLSELIYYNSDQSSNRIALETNINSHYSIF